MPSGSEPEGDRSRQAEAAAELADRAAESVDRRYDATKESFLGERDREGRDQTGQEAAEEKESEEKQNNNDENSGGRPI
jgi:hypothetical protein